MSFDASQIYLGFSDAQEKRTSESANDPLFNLFSKRQCDADITEPEPVVWPPVGSNKLGDPFRVTYLICLGTFLLSKCIFPDTSSRTVSCFSTRMSSFSLRIVERCHSFMLRCFYSLFLVCV